ncbi:MULTISPECIES: calcium-binding protein [Nostoc]|uniref:Calcium-binding protein n=1 Tax=Nostoc paludosum FACHB-159 TaxID=2692908 RepID=A0ABR8K908_9NOSO|nr:MULTISPECIES: calcium-binding protein [Nostoc]MBD2679030.1 calcium-binding protein [Nostoc sp. FACHB-857]MBD2735408.1 calcium-binding protein [Nostoc paludosum FACHB-159]
MATINGTNFNDNLVGVFDFPFFNIDFADVINGFDGNDSLTGLGTNDTLNGGNGNDTVDGGAGADIMDGGDNDDLYIVDNVGDVASEIFGDALGGVDTVQSSVTYTLSDNLENLTLTGFAAISGTGNFRNNVINGNSANNSLFGLDGNDTINGGLGNDFLDGGTGADIMDGGDNDDIYIVDNIFDVASEVFGDALGGVDTVQSSVSYTLSANLENLNLTGFEAINGTGNFRNNVINGNSGNNFLSGLDGNDTIFGGNGNDTVDGGTGADSLDGGDNDDLYIVDNVGDVATEFFGDALGGVDTVQSSVTYTLSANLENLTLTGFAAINGTGNLRDNVINGNSGNNRLSGLAGNDTIFGGNGNDTVDGGTGADRLDGGDNDDLYIVDNVGDVASEIFGDALGGVDTVQSSVSYTLSANLENLTLTGFGVINGTGNTRNNVINGNGGNNVLSGLDGNDTINGGAGNDTLNGGNGNDSLDGGAGNDSLNGGAGTDTFKGSAGNDNINGGDGIDTADYSQLGQITLSGVGTVQKAGGFGQDQLFKVEKVVANASAANNTIDASASLAGVFINVNLQTQSLSANNVPGLGVLSFTAVNFDNVIGTNANDSITGDTQNNQLSGGNGNDNINGGAGNDTLRGDGGNDNINGGAGNDRITGGNGTDVLTGGTGNDVFNYDSVSESLPGLLRDVINDFVGNGVGLGDQLDLSDIDANPFLAGNQAFTFGGAFGVGSLRYAGGILQGNLDLDASAEFEIRLVGAPALFVAAGNPGSDIIL